MIPKNLERMRSEQLKTLRSVVEFYEKQIHEKLDERNFLMARSWYAELSGAYMLAQRLGLEEPDCWKRQNALFKVIQTAEFGPRREE